ncbi:diguanylate cyclase (GGDEF) domain-containing protein [Gracilibacillus orientalis]|uniref:Diguanylate cyclase (GGDEF) domain-containing protein n=1 Tax=Gracilibacillus orientalis TaxID=334253 RepID=A0A1I4R160_9BACI|nr:bifunctional diguanylate cyclase/phosphodiesterase [Gracilibacillus orientalis]SFM45981.1 diguanylate cyclase (GGDEF) domain-containing protein [Gracilibacillus orientalis]
MPHESNVFPGTDDLLRILQHNMNLMFVIRKQKGKFYCTFLSGKLKEQLKLLDIMTDSGGNIKKLDSTFLSLQKNKLIEAFTGTEITFKHQFHQHYLFTMLSPIIKDEEVIEVIGTTIDITSFKKSEQQIELMATHDILTKLPNRQKLLDDLDKTIHNNRKDKPKAIMVCDLDRLKNVNDTLGQFAGDKVITLIADRLKESTLETCPVYRLGGDEFVIVIDEHVPDLKVFAEQILQIVRQPINISDHDFYMTGTIGISYINQRACKTEDYINRASIAVHYGKVQGGNRISEYTNKMSEQYNELILLESDIRKAFKFNEFTLSYQPKVDVHTNEIVGVEALIRWEHGKKGRIPPSLFIPVAEEIGMIDQIGEWVLREACNQFVRWQESGATPVIVAVNISAIELQQPDFLPRVKQIIKETGMDPHYLEIEITENSVMQNTEECIEMMNELRAMGVSLSIDDFGTGYSSMGYLQKFPINYLKIDQSFIKELFEESGSAEIIKAMIQLGHTFGLKVVAEGVEAEKILSFIRNEKCDYYQGYFYSKPLEADLIEEKLLAFS